MHVELMRDKALTFPTFSEPEEVQTLRVWHCKYGTIAGLRELRHLIGLEVATFPDASLDALSDLRELRYLSILHLPHVTTLEPLAALSSLVTLRLSTLPSWDSSRRKTTVESLAPLGQLSELRHVELLGVVPADGSLHPLEACRELETARFHLIPKPEVARFFAASHVRNDLAPELQPW